MKVFRACLTLGFVVSSGMAQLCEGANADSLELNQEDLRITIHVFNYARIARAMFLEPAEGSHVCEGAASIKDAPRHRPCDGLYDSTNLFLEIQPWSTVKTLGLNETMLGACTASLDGGHHTQALVSYGRVEFLAFQWDIDGARILGAAAAHEIGHLLLRQPSHSSVGIMRSDFSKEDFRYFNWRHLRFTDEQAQAIQAEVLARFGAAKPSNIK